MHAFDPATDELAEQILEYALGRVRLDPPPLDGPRTEAELRAACGDTITPDGIGGDRALALFTDVLAPACISVDHARFFAFVPAAPTDAAVLFDLIVGASSIYGGSWMEGAGAVHAENEALRWLAGVAGLPEGAGGVFVSGGSAGNLSALAAARYTWRSRSGQDTPRVPGIIACAESAHSSIKAAARVMDCDVVAVPGDDRGRLSGAALRASLDALQPQDAARVFAVVATAGATNTGVIDDLAGVADVCSDRGLWFHVDGAYGGAGLLAPSVRAQFDGIERADSFVVDPHKWLFAPYDCAALLYRDPQLARAAHTQYAEYLDVLTGTADWNPADYAYHLTRRARGLPFWFSLATHGTDAYRDAVEYALSLTSQAAELVRETPYTELVLDPSLSVIVFRRTGWAPQDYQAWSDRMLAEGVTFTVPTSWRGETVLRCCFINPRTTVEDVRTIVEAMA
jgi:L-2,4-diaminobutyrate decarboxylase